MGGGEMKRIFLINIVTFFAVCVFVSPSVAHIFGQYITGESTASLVDEGEYTGLYRYDISISWNLKYPYSHLNNFDIILNQASLSPDTIIEFSTAAGHSTGRFLSDNIQDATWTGSFLASNISLGDKPVIEYDPVNLIGHIGSRGYGVFSFYSNMIPEYGVYDDVLATEHGFRSVTYGTLTGAYPSGTITASTNVPEPATITLLGLGLTFVFVTKKR